MAHKRKGVTLIELMVVVAIMAVLMFLLTPYFQDVYYEAAATATQNDLFELKKAALNYRANSKNGQYPDTLSEIVNGLPATNSRTGRKIRFIEKSEWFTNDAADASKIVDNWGNAIEYSKSATDGESYVKSTGNGKADIIVEF
jgi:prepilin-type N-terminal cleavage/methylation domain-containing protein